MPNPFAYEPDTEVYLCNVPFDISQKNQIMLTNGNESYTVEKQNAFFMDRILYSSKDFTFQRKDLVIRYPYNADVLRGVGVNYCFYRNKHYFAAGYPYRGWVYCFITDIEFLNENVSAIHIKTDVFQTYFFDMEILPSFIEREHTVTDDPFQHTLPENIVNIEYTCTRKENWHSEFNATTSTQFAQNYWCGILTSEPIQYAAETPGTPDNFMGGIPNPCYFYGVPLNELNWFIARVNEGGQGNAVIACMAVPKSICRYTALSGAGGHSLGLLSDLYSNLTPPVGRPNQAAWANVGGTIDGYTPKNKKCYCYPYNYLELDNGAGNKTVIKYENCTIQDLSQYGLNGNIPFQEVPVLSQNPNVTVIPMEYEGEFTNMKYAIQSANFPPLPWNYDSFKNWYAQNSNSIVFGAIQDTVGLGFNLASGNVMGAFSTGMGMVGNSMSMLDRMNIPQSTQNPVLGNVLAYSANSGLYYKHICAKAEYIKIIDDYFTRFGYMVNDTRTPRLMNRPNFDYIKTRDINIRFQRGQGGQQINSGIPQNDMIELKAIFDNGVTLWHNINTYGDYAVNNQPI